MKLTVSPTPSRSAGSDTQRARLSPSSVSRMVPLALAERFPFRVSRLGKAPCQTTRQNEVCETPAVAQPRFG